MRGLRVAAAVAALSAAALVGRQTAGPAPLPSCSTRDGDHLVDLGFHPPDECLALVLRHRQSRLAKDAGP